MAGEPIDTTILLTGPVTVYEVGTIRETLLAAVAEGTAVRIDLSDSGPWDVAGLQLLISCVKFGQERSQAVQLVNAPRVCSELAERSGLSEWLCSVEG
jgi:ABC-type transporter Mla MlaB component